MKTFLLSLLLLHLAGFLVWGQARLPAYQAKFNELQHLTVPQLERPARSLALEMEYGKPWVLNPEEVTAIRAAAPKAVKLVYTDYPKGLDLDGLNTRRLAQLYDVLPEFFEDPDISFYIVKQTACHTKEEAMQMFHGFLFVVGPEHAPRAHSGTVKKTPFPAELPEVVEAMLKKIPRGDWKFLSTGRDTVSATVMERKAPEWETAVVVSDWTASMYPYTTQLLRWHLERQQASPIIHFVFFNDGDHKLTIDKKIGETGGIYSITADSVEAVINMMKYVMKQGDGGDLPENDIEALLFAIERFPQAKEIVLVADNNSQIRDMALLPGVNRPVRVVIGRLTLNELAYLNPQYIELAYRSGGSLHTLDTDYETPDALLKLRDESKRQREALRSEKKQKAKF